MHKLLRRLRLRYNLIGACSNSSETVSPLKDFEEDYFIRPERDMNALETVKAAAKPTVNSRSMVRFNSRWCDLIMEAPQTGVG
jgi:hypothetical protein